MLKEGDFIYLYNDKATYMIPFQKNYCFSTHKGNIRFPEELEFGDKLITNMGDEFYILKPTLADYMMKVKRRTTIIYPKEAGTIILELAISSGKRVIEIGTGSGSLSLLLSSLVGESGKIYSFERREEHLENAKKNVKKFGFGNNIEYFLKDPLAEGGFGVEEIDSIFIDVPAPWTLVECAWQALSNGGHIGFLSPNIEQVQKTAEELHKVGFARIRCMEILSRGIRIKKNLTRPFDRMIGHTGYLLFAQKVKKGNAELDFSI
jgi:tRNA (adenine57-N1/adenine58-N1)-methyltransferase